jgi:hypothetical protein
MRASIRDKKRSRYATSDERNSSEKVRDLDVRGFHENDGRALECRDRQGRIRIQWDFIGNPKEKIKAT